MGEIVAVLSLIFTLLVWYFLVEYKLSKLRTRIRMLDDVYVGKENAAAAIAVLERLIQNLNALCKDHQKRLDILEAGHPDDEIDYGTVDDNGNITEVWFEGKRYVPEDKRNDIDYTKTDGDGNILAVWFKGKKYVPEDKRDEDAIKIYVDNKVIAETTRPDPHSESRYTCADCVRFRRERIDGKWRGICSVDNVIMSDDEQYICDKFRLYKTTGELVCNNYEKAYAATKGEVDHPYVQYKNMSGNGRAEEEAKYIVKLNYLASDDECNELLKRVERLDHIYDAGLMSLSEYGEMLKELMHK